MDVTVVIPAHQSGRWILGAVSSALEQGTPAPAIVVVDDGSTDDTAAILSRFGAAITVIHHDQSMGSNATRNHGLSQVSTTWVQFLDADDTLPAGKLQAQLEAADRSGAEVVFGPTRELLFDDDPSTPSQEIDHLPEDTEDTILMWIRWEFAQTGALLWRTDALRRIGGWNEKQPYCQDNELCLRALLADLKITYCPHLASLYHVRSNGSLSRSRPLQILQERSRLTDVLLDELSTRDGLKDVHVAAAGRAAFAAARTWAQYDLQGALTYAKNQREKGRWAIDSRLSNEWFVRVSKRFGFTTAAYLMTMKRKLLGAA